MLVQKHQYRYDTADGTHVKASEMRCEHPPAKASDTQQETDDDLNTNTSKSDKVLLR